MPYQKANPSKAVKVVIQGGLVPTEVLQQLTRWGLLPESSVGLNGTQPTDFETEWDTAEEFVKELGAALAKEASTIRETELDHAGGFQECCMEFEDKSVKTSMVFVDKLGRLITPAGEPYEQLRSVMLEGETVRRTVVKREARYEGDRITSLVQYPESMEVKHGSDSAN